MTFQGVIAFLPRSSISRNPADQVAAQAINVLGVRLTDAGWSRILTELLAAQVFALPINSLDELHTLMKDAVVPIPANLELVAGDWRNAEAFVVPAGAGGAAATVRRQLQPIRFLSLLDALAVEEPATRLPLGLFCTIVASIGPCLTQAARRVETSSVQLTASTLRFHLAGSARTDGPLAMNVASFVKLKMLPYQIRNPGVTEDSLHNCQRQGLREEERC